MVPLARVPVEQSPPPFHRTCPRAQRTPVSDTTIATLGWGLLTCSTTVQQLVVEEVVVVEMMIAASTTTMLETV